MNTCVTLDRSVRPDERLNKVKASGRLVWICCLTRLRMHAELNVMSVMTRDCHKTLPHAWLPCIVPCFLRLLVSFDHPSSCLSLLHRCFFFPLPLEGFSFDRVSSVQTLHICLISVYTYAYLSVEQYNFPFHISRSSRTFNWTNFVFLFVSELELGTQCVVEMSGQQTILQHPTTMDKIER